MTTQKSVWIKKTKARILKARLADERQILNLERKNYLSKKLDELEKLDDFNFILNLPDIILTINNFNY